MKTILSWMLTLIFVPFTFLPNTFAQDSPQWHLPEGAKARLGKGRLSGNIAYSPDGTRLAVASTIGIWLYDTATGQEVALLTGHTGYVNSVAFSPDGNTLASGSGDQTVRLWDMNRGAHKRTLTGHTGWVNSVAFSPDGNTLASGSGDETVRLWKVNTGAHKRTLTGHTGWVNSVAFSPDGRALASGSWREIRLWEMNRGAHKRTLTGHTGVDSVAFSPDGNTLASGSWREIRLWEMNTGAHKRTLTGHTSAVRSVAFSPDRNTLATGSWREIRLWDANTGAHKRTLTGHTGWVLSVAFSPDGNTLASGSSDATVRLWDVNTGAHQRTLTGHTRVVNSVAFSPDGRALASGGGDGTILLWELTPTTEPSRLGDVNRDGVVNILDLVFVGSNLGQTGPNDADINGDGIIDIRDLVQVASALSETITPAAPIAYLSPENGKKGGLLNLNRGMIQAWLDMAHVADDGSITYRRGIANLKRLLLTVENTDLRSLPDKTALLPNYPNPFNPETWIPYQLAHAADVEVTIYDIKGAVVRQLALGHQAVGDYTGRSKAAYWDGRNETGESVASGIYFYQLRAGDYAATKRMVILK